MESDLSHLSKVSVTALCAAVVSCLLVACAGRDSSVDAAVNVQAGISGTQTTVHASTAYVDLPTSIATADAVVIGRVVGGQWTSRGLQVSEWGRQLQYQAGYGDDDIAELEGSLKDWVYTHSRFAIDRALEGDFPDGEVEVWTVGGEFHGHVCEAPGYPQLHPGTQYVLFLVRSLHGGYVPIAVYEVHDGRATTTSQGRNDDMTVEELIAVIEEHKDDPNPWAVALEGAQNVPTDPEDHPMIPEEERGIPGETTTTVSP